MENHTHAIIIADDVIMRWKSLIVDINDKVKVADVKAPKKG